MRHALPIGHWSLGFGRWSSSDSRDSHLFSRDLRRFLSPQVIMYTYVWLIHVALSLIHRSNSDSKFVAFRSAKAIQVLRSVFRGLAPIRLAGNHYGNSCSDSDSRRNRDTHLPILIYPACPLESRLQPARFRLKAGLQSASQRHLCIKTSF